MLRKKHHLWSIYSPSLYANTQYGYYYCDYESKMLFFKYNGSSFVLESIFQKWSDGYRYNGYSTTKTNYEQQLKKYQSVINTGSKVKYPYDIFDIIPVLNYNKAERPVVTTTAATTLTTTTTQPVTTVSTPPVTDYARGNVTGDGEVSVDDAQLTLKAYTKRIAGNIHEKSTVPSAEKLIVCGSV